MTRSHRIAGAIDALNERIGQLASWLVVAVVLLGAWNAIARYISKFTELHISSNAYLELQWYLFSAIFLLGAGYTMRRDEHVRVDIWYAGRNPRTQARIDVWGTLIFLIPFCLFILWTSWPPVKNSWAIREMSPDPGGLPRYPIKTLIPIAFILLLLQAISLLTKRWHAMSCSSSTPNSPDLLNPKSKIQNPKSPEASS